MSYVGRSDAERARMLAAVGADQTHVAVTFEISEGPRIFVDHVLIVGNVRTSADTIKRELAVKEDEPLSAAKINETERRLLALGLFRRVRINELRHGDDTRREGRGPPP